MVEVEGVPCQKRRFEQKRRSAQKEYLGALRETGSCDTCGATARLEFHHPGGRKRRQKRGKKQGRKRGGQKGIRIGRGWNGFLKEISSCVLLCRRCHVEVHQVDGNWERLLKIYERYDPEVLPYILTIEEAKRTK
jgi:hypothetical protein